MDNVMEMSNMHPNHRLVMDNLVFHIRSAFQRYLYHNYWVMREAKFKWEGVQEKYEPDISIITDIHKRVGLCYTEVPLFIAEVLSPSTEEDDRKHKMQLYLKLGVSEYWLVDWRPIGGQVERYIMSDDESQYILQNKVIGLDQQMNLLTIPGIVLTMKDIMENVI